MARSDTQLTGSAGEFFVAAELARRGWIPSITPRGIERTDLLAQHSSSGAVLAVQVKTANPRNAFRLGPKDEAPARQWNEWYVFVSLGDVGERPSYFIVPTNLVSVLIFVGHRVWLSEPKRDGTSRKDSAIRAIKRSEVEAYEERWELLEEPADRAPIEVPDWVIDRAKSDIGWPQDHPGFQEAAS